MPSNLERMRAASKVPKPTPKPTANTKPMPALASSVSVKYRCDHVRAVQSFCAEDCPACRGKFRKEKAAIRRQRLAAEKSERHLFAGRLPDGAEFQSTYNAEKQQWTGILIIDGKTFAAVASSLQKGLLSELDRLYRASLSVSPPSSRQ